MTNSIFYLFFIGIFLLSGCVAQPTQTDNNNRVPINKTARINALQQLTHWSIKGKIAFITPQKRQSASFHWTVNEQSHEQHLALSTYLGINLLELNSQSGIHTIVVDGQQLQGSNLYQLIYDATGLTIPTEAMHQWLKGIVHSKQDQIQYNFASQLPNRLISKNEYGIWQIDYDDFKQVDKVQLAQKITITHRDLIIKIIINHWTLL